ncbi:MAG: ornithine aminomutase subunit alpha [Acholeplasmatales bacterium]|jgi:D-ornithine 4,5-aminomutase subunit alpha|nr:ornithine aminomutase subunit alpha [Acholeplasmataceae bacterium]MCK9289393.1 ornithine aminomutase subunit alpha [Acholeplasmataceae bacterium]MCK9428105.1 ornithine aminomutase subunit alpha [Acholeplasmataceae bacterium]MDY0115023.1 ornithine aminomutase subunit alpha [Acholeplasmatales bacterium]HHT39976.1 ornithine aminomutase [Acholeplasmataceae bacterium]
MKARKDDFEKRRKELAKLTDEELKTYFFKLTDQLLDPIMELAYNYTSPSIERSVLLRMGFSSLEAKVITEKLKDANLLSYGAGHVVYLYAKKVKKEIIEAGRLLAKGEGIALMKEVFEND